MKPRSMTGPILCLLALSGWITPDVARSQARRIPIFACASPSAHPSSPMRFQDRPCDGEDAGLQWVTPEPLHAHGAATPKAGGQGRTGRRARRTEVPITPSEPIALTSHRHGRRPFGLQDPPAKPRKARRKPGRHKPDDPDVRDARAPAPPSP